MTSNRSGVRTRCATDASTSNVVERNLRKFLRDVSATFQEQSVGHVEAVGFVNGGDFLPPSCQSRPRSSPGICSVRTTADRLFLLGGYSLGIHTRGVTATSSR